MASIIYYGERKKERGGEEKFHPLSFPPVFFPRLAPLISGLF